MLRVRPYLSWSQMSLYEYSPKAYKMRYIYNIKFPPNEGMKLGSIVADSLDTGKPTGDPKIDIPVSKVPLLGETEREINISTKNGVPLFSKIDISKKNLKAIKEVKTGKTKWTEKSVREFGQITFYCTAVYALKGFIPDDLELIHLPTLTLDNGKSQLTGEMIRIKTERIMIDILKMQGRMKKAWDGIGDLCGENNPFYKKRLYK